MGNKSHKTPLSTRPWFVCLLTFVFYPVGVFLMWKHHTFKKPIKIVLTILFLPWFAFCVLFIGLCIFFLINPDYAVPNEPEQHTEQVDNTKESPETRILVLFI